MTTLSKKLLDIYENNESLHPLIEDLAFGKICKEFLTDYVQNESTIFFHPYFFEKHSNLDSDLAFEILLSLSKNNELLEKYYVVQCDDCGNEIMEKKLENLLFCRNIECNFDVPKKGELLFDYIKENVYYKFSITENNRPLIVKENLKKFSTPSTPPNSTNSREGRTKSKKYYGEVLTESEKPFKNIKEEIDDVIEFSFNPEAAL